MKTRSWLILGTGTEIGKSRISLELMKRLGSENCCALKPVESGVGASQSDAEQLAKQCGFEPNPLRAYSFEEACTPARAARHQGEMIDFEQIRHWLAEQFQHSERRELIVESAGGTFSPLTAEKCNLDLYDCLPTEERKIVLVAADKLGVLHDVIACLRAMGPKRQPSLIVLNRLLAQPQKGEAENELSFDSSALENADELRMAGVSIPILILEYDGELQENAVFD